MALVVFSVTLAAEILAAASVAFSAAFPGRRIWPPPRPRSWQAYCLWLLFIVSGGGVAALGGATALILAPFAEEPWLLKRYGAAYEEYRRAVPRFISFRRRRCVT